jgi:hypothetical protein
MCDLPKKRGRCGRYLHCGWGSTPIPGFYTESLYSGDVASFLWHLKKRGYKDTTITQNYSKVLKNIAKNAPLNNPDAVLGYIATKDVSEGRKELLVKVYATYCRWKHIPFQKPRYKRQDRLPYVPLELDIEALLSALPKKLSIFTRAQKLFKSPHPELIWISSYMLTTPTCSISPNITVETQQEIL